MTSVRAKNSRSDFLSTPPLPPSEILGIKGDGAGLLKLSYANGKIVNLAIVKPSGIPELDAIAIRHVRRTFKLKPGVSGEINLPYSNKILVSKINLADFTARPSLEYAKGTIHSKAAAYALVTYRNGQITNVDLVASTGSKEVDQQISNHILHNWKVKPDKVGCVVLPISIAPREHKRLIDQ